MKVFISCIGIVLAISASAGEEKWYDAEGNLARVLPVSEPVEEWKPRWEREPTQKEIEFTWNTRRPYVRYSRSYRPYYGGYYFPTRYYSSRYYCPPYRYGVARRGYGLRGFYSSSGNWGVRIGN